MLKKTGYEVRVLDLINMDKSFCYNPFAYLKNDNDVQKLVTRECQENCVSSFNKSNIY